MKQNFIESTNLQVLALLGEAHDKSIQDYDDPNVDWHRIQDWSQHSADDHQKLSDYHGRVAGVEQRRGHSEVAAAHKGVAKYHSAMAKSKSPQTDDDWKKQPPKKTKQGVTLHPVVLKGKQTWASVPGNDGETDTDKSNENPDIAVHQNKAWHKFSADDHIKLAKAHHEMSNLAKQAYRPGREDLAKLAQKHKQVSDFHHNAAKHKSWFETLSDKQKKEYKELHPHSKLV